ncbi:unnamed protein product [Arabidopsis arenosa]|uniref:Plant heme peroxidase family profile domain-containing protein n=1 Tax=Arabidopsis arenosa TaxID=38785 RepID=A0A8S2ASW7_ARAAE|nr:unnamed protein product [Arabidopsis arenosa]
MKEIELLAARASGWVEAGTGKSRLRDFFSSLLTSLGGALLQITEEEDEQQVSDIMSSTVSDLPHQRGIAGEIKSKNVAGHGRQNRKVLGDISNLVTGRDIVPGKDLMKKVKPQTKAEAASGPKDAVINIDDVDANNELAAVEYVDDIFKFYRTVEEEGGIKEYIGSQPEINEKMRSILIDWLVDVHRKFELMPETLYLTINLVDRRYAYMLIQGKSLFSSDEALLAVPSTKKLVAKYANSNEEFERAFVKSMIKMSSISGNGNEVRLNCRRVR